MTTTTHDWNWLEKFLEGLFKGERRKNGEEMVWHSIRVGRALRREGRDAVTVFAGYCHDVIEDLEGGRDYLKDMLLGAARFVLGNKNDAEEAVLLVEECSYTEEEYRLPKAERKKAACARWIASANPRVAYVKKADVEDNRADAATVSVEFEAEYLSWAGPLHDELCRIIDARDGAALAR